MKPSTQVLSRSSRDLVFIAATLAVLLMAAAFALFGSAPALAQDCGDYARDGGDGCAGDINDPRPTGSVTLTANPSSIHPGDASVLSWDGDAAAHGAICSITPTVGSINSIPWPGTYTVHPLVTTTYELDCYTAWGYGADASTTVTVTPYTAPTASLTSNPTSVVQGSSSTLTWSSTNATSCTGTNFSTGNAVSGSLAVAPGSTTNYSVSCTGPGGTTSAATSVTVIPTLTGSCSVSPTSIQAGQSATWTAVAGGGTGAYTYSWSGTGGLTGSASTASQTYGSSGAYTGSVTITSGTQSHTFACSNSLAVSALLPDLTAGSVSPTSATAGSAVTLSASVANSGNGSTGAGFNDLFQRATDSGGSGATDIGTYASAALGASGSNSASLSYSFPSGGTWYVRACADKSSAGDTNGAITESSEVNNCGPWTAISVNNAIPPSLSCTPSASSVNTGQNVTYTVTPAGGATGPYNWTDSDSWTGTGSSVTRTYSVGGTYAMSVRGGNVGSTFCSPQVSVAASTCGGPASVSISANPTRVRAGSTATITWSASNVPGASPSCTVSGPGVSQNISAGAPPTCSIPNGSANPVINTQSTYTITCGGVSQSVTVNVIPKIIEF